MSVYKREWKDKQGRTRSCWYFHKTINGQRYRDRIPTARTKAQAEEGERKILAEIHAGVYGNRRSSQLLSDFIDKVYLPWSKTNKRDPRHDEIHCNVLKAFFAGKTISQVSPILVEKFKRERIKTKTIHDRARTPATVNRELAALSRILTMAVDNGLIASNPCRRVKKFREDNQRTRYLSVEEEEKLLAQCVDQRAYLRPIILLAVNTGMRRGEILSLKWSQVDFSRRLIYVTNTKTEKDRVIPMNETVARTLESLPRKDERVFRVTDFKKAFAGACDKAEITGLRFHDLRHTAATRLADGGADAFTIAAILGHSTIQMSARYTHATDERKRRAVEAIEGLSQKPGHKSVTKIKLA